MRIATDIVNSIRNRDDSHLTDCVNGEEFEKWLYGGDNMLKLFKVECYYDSELKDNTFTCIAIAGNEIEVKRIVEEEVWTLSGMKIKSVEEIDMHFPQLLVAVDSREFE